MCRAQWSQRPRKLETSKIIWAKRGGGGQADAKWKTPSPRTLWERKEWNGGWRLGQPTARSINSPFFILSLPLSSSFKAFVLSHLSSSTIPIYFSFYFACSALLVGSQQFNPSTFIRSIIKNSVLSNSFRPTFHQWVYWGIWSFPILARVIKNKNTSPSPP
jgi:hypothetical protein